MGGGRTHECPIPDVTSASPVTEAGGEARAAVGEGAARPEVSSTSPSSFAISPADARFLSPEGEITEEELVKLLRAQEAAVLHEIEELSALMLEQDLETQKALSEADTLGAAVDEARDELEKATDEVATLTQQLVDAQHGRLPPRLYVLGGMTDRDSRLRTVECFNGKRWSRLQANLNFTRSAPAAAVYNGGLYAVGGYDGSTDSNTVDRYDGDSWVTVAPMQNRRSTCGAVTFNDCLYVIGGCDGVDASETRHRTVEKWNGVRWCESEPMHECRSGVCCTVFNGHIYALGGRNMNNSILRTVERFNGRTWESVPNMKTARVQAAAVAFQGKIFVIGGQDSQSSQLIEAFDGTKWENVPSPPEIRAAKGMAVAVFNDALYVIGGHSGLSYFRDVFCFDGKEWVAAPPLPSTRSVSAAVSY